MYLIRCKLGQHVASGSNPKRTQKNVYYAMDMMERKTVNNVIIFIPVPCFYQRTNLGSDKIDIKKINILPIHKLYKIVLNRPRI